MLREALAGTHVIRARNTLVMQLLLLLVNAPYQKVTMLGGDVFMLVFVGLHFSFPYNRYYFVPII